MIRNLVSLTAFTVLVFQLPHRVLAQSQVTLTVYGTSDIFGAGLTSPPPLYGSHGPGTAGGTLPPGHLLPPGSAGNVVTFANVTGTFRGCNVSSPLCLPVNPDGVALSGAATGGTNLSSYGGISGIEDDNRFGFLVGVFTPAGGCTAPAPPFVNFTYSSGNPSFSPLLCQTFFVGDGLTGNGTGTVQRFIIPVGATAVYLGFADGSGAQGTPGYYDDNTGSMTATVTSAGPAEQILPQVAFGGSWYTGLYFTNIASTPVSFTVSFIGDDGTPLTIPAIGASSMTVHLAGRGTASRKFQTPVHWCKDMSRRHCLPGSRATPSSARASPA